MKTITATELNKTPGAYLMAALIEPVLIEKNRREAVVLMSFDRYQELVSAKKQSAVLQSGYEAMAKDKNRESAADEWSENLLGDID